MTTALHISNSAGLLWQHSPAVRRQCSSHCRCRAASKPGPLVSLVSLPDVQSSVTVAERRAADVAIIGGGIIATLAAYTLAKTGRKVLLLPDYGLSAATPAGTLLQPLKLTDTDPLLVHLSSESAAYWRGLELLAGDKALLTPQQTCDLVLNPDRDHLGAEGFSKLQDACRSAGVTTVPLSSSEACSRFRQLQLPHSSAALLQPDGGLIHAGDAAAAARQLAENVGVMMRPGLLLRGWRDRGSCFQLRASSRLTPDLVSLYEAEVLLLAPGQWHASALRLFALQAEGLQAREVLHCRAPAGILQQQQQLPLWQSWGAFTPPDQPATIPAVAGLPLMPDSSAWAVQQLPAWGVQVEDPRTWQPAAQQWTGAIRGTEQTKEEELAASTSSSSSWVDVQVQQLHQTCTQLVRDIGPLSSMTVSSCIRSCTADGRPVIGQHPAFDPGRVVVCLGASGAEPFGPGSCSSSYQMSPMLAKLAADVIKSAGGVASDAAVLAGVGLQREGLGSGIVSGFEGFDSWEGLQVLQQLRAVAPEEVERQQDEAADKRQDLRNLETLPGLPRSCLDGC